MRRLPLQDPLWSDRIVVTGVKCHVLIEAIRNRAACHRAIENAAGDVAIVFHVTIKLAFGDQAVGLICDRAIKSAAFGLMRGVDLVNNKIY